MFQCFNLQATKIFIVTSATKGGWLPSVRIVQKEVGGRIFSLGGGLRDEVGVEIFFDTGLKKKWGLNFIINYRRKR